jgi:hypothetical protein
MSDQLNATDPNATDPNATDPNATDPNTAAVATVEPSGPLRIKRSFTMRLLGGETEAHKCLVIKGPHRMGSLIGQMTGHDIKLGRLPNGEATESVRIKGIFEGIRNTGEVVGGLSEAYLPDRVAQYIVAKYDQADGSTMDIYLDIDAVPASVAGRIPFEYDVAMHKVDTAPDPLDRVRAMRANVQAGRPVMHGLTLQIEAPSPVTNNLGLPSPVDLASGQTAELSGSGATASSSDVRHGAKSGARRAA